MNVKKTLIFLALIFSLLVFSSARFTVAPSYPCIKVTPETILLEAVPIGTTFEVSIYTDYTGSDVYSWQFELTFNPAVLEGVSVENGNLITTAKHSSARYSSQGFNNTAGRLKLTMAYFYYVAPSTPFTTSGPGILANATFSVKGYGMSELTLVDTTQVVRLQGFDTVLEEPYDVINGFFMPYNLGHGYFRNSIEGDANLDQTVNVFDILAVKSRWGSTPADPDWIREYDVNDDAAINVFDILTVKANWGSTYP